MSTRALNGIEHATSSSYHSNAEAPIVGTGIEYRAARDSSVCVAKDATGDGIVRVTADGNR